MQSKSAKVGCAWITAIAFLSALATSSRLIAQESKEAKIQSGHHHYKLLDMGTLGGPSSFIGYLVQPLNDKGTVSSVADTALLDPNFPNVATPVGTDPYVQHTFLWHHGTLKDLGALPGGTSSSPNWINRRGLVAGYSTNGQLDPLTGIPAIRATLWENDNVLDLGTLGGNEGQAFAVNDSGEVVGGALNDIADPYTSNYFNFFVQGATQVHAFRWKNGKMEDLGTRGGPDSVAYYVTGGGKIIGASFTGYTPNAATGIPTMDPFIWDNGKMVDLGTLGGTLGTPNWFNERGQVAGASNILGDQFSHPFFWDGSKMFDLGTFGGEGGAANWINESGEIVGVADFPGDQVHHAFLWKDGEKQDLGTVSNDGCSQALGINSREQIIGTSTNCHNVVQHVFLWENGGPMTDLASLLSEVLPMTLTEVDFINDRGEIVGNGVLPNGDTHAVLFIPCDDEHPGIEGCDYSVAEPGVTEAASAAAARAAILVPRVQVPASLSNLTPAECAARMGSVLATHRGRCKFTQPK